MGFSSYQNIQVPVDPTFNVTTSSDTPPNYLNNFSCSWTFGSGTPINNQVEGAQHIDSEEAGFRVGEDTSSGFIFFQDYNGGPTITEPAVNGDIISVTGGWYPTPTPGIYFNVTKNGILVYSAVGYLQPASPAPIYIRFSATGAGTNQGSVFWSENASLEAPILISPVDDAENVLLDTVFYWNSSSLAESYRIQVSKDPLFSSFIINEVTTSTFYLQPSTLLENDIIYFWQVYAIRGIETALSEKWLFTTVKKSSNYCPYPDEKWTYNAVIKDRLANNYFGVAAGNFSNLVAYLCSNDTISSDAVYIVLLRTREGESYLTTCERINYGKLPDIIGCDDPYHKALKYLFCGEKGKQDRSGGLDKVSVGYVVDSTFQTVTVKSQIGEIVVENDFGSVLPTGIKVVIFNEDRENNFTKVLGPAQP